MKTQLLLMIALSISTVLAAQPNNNNNNNRRNLNNNRNLNLNNNTNPDTSNIFNNNNFNNNNTFNNNNNNLNINRNFNNNNRPPEDGAKAPQTTDTSVMVDTSSYPNEMGQPLYTTSGGDRGDGGGFNWTWLGLLGLLGLFGLVRNRETPIRTIERNRDPYTGKGAATVYPGNP